MQRGPHSGRRIAHAILRRARRVLDDTDRGDVIGWALMVPVVMALTIGGIQVVMWYQARNVCQAAAHAGVQAGKAMGSSTGAGSAAATNYLSQTGGGSVVGAQASETVTATTVTVTCTANAERVIPLPGFSVAVNQSVSSQRERFTTPTDAP